MEEFKKVCEKCGRTLPLSMFWKDKKRKDGYAKVCKDCKAHRPIVTSKQFIENQKAKMEELSIHVLGEDADRRPLISTFSTKELLEEIKNRGFEGTLRKTVVFTIGNDTITEE